MRRNRPSGTARRVALAIAFLGADPEVAALLPPKLVTTTEQLLLASGTSQRRLRWLERPFVRRLVYFSDSLGAEGQLLFVGLRKRLVTDEATAAIAAGCRQLLVVGGGLDTLALRMAAAHPQVRCVELDHPASQTVKRAALDSLGPLPANLQLVAADLGAVGLEGALAAAAGWDPAAPTFAVAEAVLMYLERRAIESFLRQLHASIGPGSTLLFSSIRSDAEGRMLLGKRPRLAAASLAAGGEPLRWIAAPGELGPMLERAGWTLADEHVDLRRRYLEPAGLGARALADIEVYARATRD